MLFRQWTLSTETVLRIKCSISIKILYLINIGFMRWLNIEIIGPANIKDSMLFRPWTLSTETVLQIKCSVSIKILSLTNTCLMHWLNMKIVGPTNIEDSLLLRPFDLHVVPMCWITSPYNIETQCWIFSTKFYIGYVSLGEHISHNVELMCRFLGGTNIRIQCLISYKSTCWPNIQYERNMSMKLQY